MKILICGNLGYIGPSVVWQLRKSYPDSELVGYDIGYFAHVFLDNSILYPELLLNKQIYGDIRKISSHFLRGFDVVVNLAAISNDAMGLKFEQVTLDINFHAAVRLAELAKENGIKSYIFASSCSMYGLADGYERKESDPLNPVTNYSRSKMMAEIGLQPLGTDNFNITCLRLATACGWTSRLRLDLVLNDFVASAILYKEIIVLSDGSPWRPIVNSKDIARAVDWSINRTQVDSSKFLIVNVGANSMNYKIKDLAEAVALIIPKTRISINTKSVPDKRSYRVNFDLFEKLAPSHQPVENLNSTIKNLEKYMTELNFKSANFRNSQYIRFNVLNNLVETGQLNQSLVWKS